MDKIVDITLYFTLLLAIALLIERVLEITKVIYDFVDGRYDFYRYWTQRTQALKHILAHRVEALRHADSSLVQAVMRRVDDLVLNNNGTYGGTVIVISADAMRVNAVRVTFKALGILLGIVVAVWLQIDFVDLYNNTMKNVPAWQHVLHTVFSGVALGLGSGPMHKIITTLERKQKESAAAKKQQRSGS